MVNHNEKITNYLSPTDLKKLNTVLENAIKNAQTISEIKQNARMNSEILTNNQRRIQQETELGYKIIDDIKRKAMDRKRRERNLKIRATKVDPEILNSIKEEFQNPGVERKENKEEYQPH